MAQFTHFCQGKADASNQTNCAQSLSLSNLIIMICFLLQAWLKSGRSQRPTSNWTMGQASQLVSCSAAYNFTMDCSFHIVMGDTRRRTSIVWPEQVLFLTAMEKARCLPSSCAWPWAHQLLQHLTQAWLRWGWLPMQTGQDFAWGHDQLGTQQRSQRPCQAPYLQEKLLFGRLVSRCFMAILKMSYLNETNEATSVALQIKDFFKDPADYLKLAVQLVSLRSCVFSMIA